MSKQPEPSQKNKIHALLKYDNAINNRGGMMDNPRTTAIAMLIIGVFVLSAAKAITYENKLDYTKEIILKEGTIKTKTYKLPQLENDSNEGALDELGKIQRYEGRVAIPSEFLAFPAIILIFNGLGCLLLGRNRSVIRQQIAGLKYASFSTRLGALLIDSIVVAIGFIVVLVISDQMIAEKEMGFLPTLLLMLFYFFYFAGMESSSEQGTLGKMALRIKVTDANGARISFGKALNRNLAKLFSLAILGFGFFMAYFTEKSQGLHDIIAGTYVVKER